MSADPIELSEKVRSSLSGLEGDALVIAINSLRETIHEFSRMIARFKLWLALRRRKTDRIVEQERARKAYWQAERRRHDNDPLMRGWA
jgi:hypothetical protein